MDVILTGKEYTGIGLNFKMTIKFPLHLASFVAHLVKNPPAMWDTWVWSLGLEDPLEKGKATHSIQYSNLENSMDYSPWGRKELDTTERLLLFFPFLLYYSVGVLENFLADIKNKTKQKTPQLWRNQQSLPGIFFSTGHLEFDAVISNAVIDAVFDLINFT